MEPNKNLENQFKTKLNERQIVPSTAAWDRLNAMLTVTETKAPKKKTNWLYIAATLIGMLFSGFVLYQVKTNSFTTQNKIVESKKSPVYNTSNFNNKPENQVMANRPDKIIKNTEKAALYVQPTKPSFINTVNKTLISAVQEQPTTSAVQPISNEHSASKNNVTIEALLAEVPTSEPVSVAITVNANSLLSQVNGELSQEFRETKFQKLKRNFQNVKVAMEARNNK